MSTWGVYALQGRAADGTTVAASDRRAVKFFVRWRVDGASPRKRTFTQKGHAKTFRDLLMKAKVLGWDADERGWPIDPTTSRTPAPVAPTLKPGLSLREYAEGTWWPMLDPTFGAKNRVGHRTNLRTLLDLVTYREGDRRIGTRPGTAPGDSILLDDLVADDLRLALVQRRGINGRTAAVNQRRIQHGLDTGLDEVELLPETASAATLRSFYITMSMVVKAAMKSGHTQGDPLDGVSTLAPKPRPSRLTDRVVPSLDEVFDLADAIAELGPTVDGRPAGVRLRSLILAAGTLGPRPGELTRHSPDWITWATPVTVRFYESEAPVYDRQAGVSGLQAGPLKHRQPGECREVPAIDAVADALRQHLDAGYAGIDRTWTSPTGRGRLNWGNLTETYWRPACTKVFAGTAKHDLALASPKILRKAAITFWLDSGISPLVAAEWAGHSEEVARQYYAGRADTSYAAEAAKLAANSGRRPLS